MPPLVSMDEAVERTAAMTGPSLIGVDGLPAAGKSTLVDHVRDRSGFECIWLDEFVRPESEWQHLSRPAFPFEYVRYADFLDAVRALGTSGICRYESYDWSTGAVSTSLREVRLDRPVIVEGVSALHPGLAPLYVLRVYVESDRATTLDAALRRGVGTWERHWRELFLPSTQLYLQTRPWERADLRVRGRGA